jgi:hypothetical protein
VNFLPYAKDPNHIWNRVHRRLLERRDAKGKTWGCDEVDPLLWTDSKHILSKTMYAGTMDLLDEFITTHAEQLVRDPLRRAVFQRDLWAVFDWLARGSDDHPQERVKLERRLAVIIKAVALTRDEIRHLPDNYADLSGSTVGKILSPPDTAQGWLQIGREDGTPVAPVHASYFPRSLFLVYLWLPPGGAKASQYLESTRTYSRKRREGGNCLLHACVPPQFAVGTRLALVRRALLIDTTGQPVVSPITESIQLRRYQEVPAGNVLDYDGRIQQVAEFQLTRLELTRDSVGLRRVTENERQFLVFRSHEIDVFERGWDATKQRVEQLRSCHICHQGVGVASFESYSPRSGGVLLRASTEEEETISAIKYLQTRDSWLVLQRLMP